MPLLRKRGARVRRVPLHGLRNFRLHHLQLPRDHVVQEMRRETTRAAVDAEQLTEDRLARALSESVTAIAAIAPMLCEPDVRATQVSQLLHGHIALVVERNGLWLHVKGADGSPGYKVRRKASSASRSAIGRAAADPIRCEGSASSAASEG